MNFLNRIKNALNGVKSVFGVQLITQNTFNTFSYRGQVYRSDIVRACIRPFANTISKLQAKHIRELPNREIQINPEPYIKLLLESPNPYMSGQVLLYKLAVQLKLNSNAFAYIHRDECGYPMQIYPIPAYSATAIYDEYGYLYIKFMLKNGKSPVFAYKDLIHLRQDYNENDIFGDNPQETITDLMDIVATTDSGIKSAIKNGGLIKWLLKFKQQYKAEHLKREAKAFVNDYLKPDDTGDSSIAAAIDNKADIEQVKPNDYVPNATQMDKTVTRIYNFFGTNEKIIQSKFNEDEWNAYYKAEIEPVTIQLQKEFTNKLFSSRERGCGNSIIFEETALQCASITTKLNLLQMVDRGAMTPNEWRKTFNLSPIQGGDIPIRRLDTAPADNNGKEENV